jgi:hypothetical protein
VTPASATLGRRWETSEDYIVSIDADHSDMVKFPQPDQDGYIKARYELRKFAEQAIVVIERRHRSMNSTVSLPQIVVEQHLLMTSRTESASS